MKGLRPVLLAWAACLSGGCLARGPAEREFGEEYAVQNPWPFPAEASEIARYTAYSAAGPIVVDGRLDEDAWARAPAAGPFVDLISGAPTHLDTRVALAWDAANLYVGYWVREPDVRARLTRRDAPIYTENDVELFIAGADAYYEFEINALNTIYEVFFIWQDAYDRLGFAEEPLFRRDHPRVAPFNGVGFTCHPRGPRLGCFDWDFPGLRAAVHVDGTLNDGADRDRGWTVEMALPWEGMRWLARDGRRLPPRDGDEWRIAFMRFNTQRGTASDSGGWALNRHGVWDSHIPELFPRVLFRDETPPPR